MLREIVLDTETTGFDPFRGDRIVEIGCVELIDHLPSGAVFHKYINPQRAIPQSAIDIHGITDARVANEPIFSAPEIGPAFRAFIADAPLIIHNAAFDMKFLNWELQNAKLPTIPDEQAVDTLEIARGRFPGSPASLDALCKRFGVDLGRRDKHGALLDSELLAEVYLDLIGARQTALLLDPRAGGAARPDYAPPPRPAPLPPRLTEAERAAHEAFINEMGDAALWRK